MRRRESRVVRPILTLDTALAETAMRLHPDQEFTTERPLQLPSEGSDYTPQIRPVVCKAVLQDHYGDIWNKLTFLLYVVERLLHKSTVIFSCPLDNIPDEIDLVTMDPSGQIYWGGVTSYVACIALAEPVPVTRDRSSPSRKGHWIARKRFEVPSRQLSEGFPIEVWGADRFREFGLSSRTAFCVLVNDAEELLGQPDSIDNAVRVIVHEDMAYIISRDKALQHMIATEVASETIYRALRAAIQNGLTLSDLDEYSFLARWVSRLRRGTGISEETLLRAAREEDYALIRSIVQSRQDLLTELTRLSRY